MESTSSFQQSVGLGQCNEKPLYSSMSFASLQEKIDYLARLISQDKAVDLSKIMTSSILDLEMLDEELWDSKTFAYGVAEIAKKHELPEKIVRDVLEKALTFDYNGHYNLNRHILLKTVKKNVHIMQNLFDQSIRMCKFLEKPDPQMIEAIPMINYLGQISIPHLTRIYGLQSFHAIDRTDGKTKIDYLCMQMELLEGSLSSAEPGAGVQVLSSNLNPIIVEDPIPTLTDEEKDAITIQRLFTTCVLKQHYVYPQDLVPTNVFYKRLGLHDVFKEKFLINYDYWLYKVELAALAAADTDRVREFYIPKPKYLIKLGDFNDWYIEGGPISMAKEIEELRDFNQDKFTKPFGVTDDKILTVSTIIEEPESSE